MIKFPYMQYGPNPRPVIPVVISNKGKKVSEMALIDSGSDMCVFDANIARVLGIDNSTGQQHTIGGLGGTQHESFTHTVTLIVGKQSVTVPVAFMRQVSGAFQYGILGQRGFFENFLIKFDLSKREVSVKRN